MQRFANALKARGIGAGDVVGIYLPMIPEVVVAMLACARIGAPHNVVFGGFSAESVQRAHGVLRGQGAGHRRRRRRKGKTAPVKAQVDEVDGRLPTLERSRRPPRGVDCPMGEARRLVRRGARAGRRGVPGRAARRRAPALHPLLVGLDGEAQGHPAHDRGLPHRRRVDAQHVFDLKPEGDVYWCAADVGWITGHSYIVYGPLANGATSVMYEGAPDYPHKGIWWELSSATA